jgi:5-deoxy-glucuronate isomerase
MTTNLHRPADGARAIDVTRQAMGWWHLDFSVHALRAGDVVELDTDGRETAVIAISGTAAAQADGRDYELARRNVFDEVGSVLYVPPGADARVTAQTFCRVALGAAPASGRYPVRLIAPEDVRAELRGGGAARRQVNHVLAPPLPAERLIVYEVLVPGGSWAGWPPHCHDGEHGSPYLEETYYFRFDRPDGFGFHRNYLADGSYDETFTVRDGDCVAVPRGFHVTTAAPGHNLWILNFLAGDLLGEERATPPYFDPATTWITEDWDRGQMPLPAAGAASASGSWL